MSKMRINPKALLTAAMAGAFAFLALADADVYGNEIKTYTEGGVQKTYQFWVSGDKAEVATKNGTSAVSSNEDVALDAVFKSVWTSVGGWLYSTKCGITLIVF